MGHGESLALRAFWGVAFTIRSLEETVLAHPGVLEVEITVDERRDTLNMELKLVERDFDLAQFKFAMRERMPVAVEFNVTVSGQVHPDKPNPFEHVTFQDYDVDMSDAELAYRLKTLRG